MTSRRVFFSSTRGYRLAARLDHGEGTPRAYALFAHCFTCSKDLKATHRISRALVESGYAVLRFDFTGLGESEGDFADTDFSSNLEDLLSATEYLRQEHAAPQLLIGHSLGGAAVLTIAAEVPECRAVVTLGAPSDTRHLRRTLLRSQPKLEEEDAAEVQLAGRSFRIRREFLEDLDRGERVLDALPRLGKALLILHSPVDEVVDIDHARRIYQAAVHPKSFVSLDDADHLLVRRSADARYAAGVLAAWAERYLDAEETPETESQTEHGEVLVRGGAEGYYQRITAGSHQMEADEPRSVGGTDRGPTPYDLLLASLGTCTAMTLRMYADRKEWPLGEVEVRLRHSKIHAKDCESCVTEKGKIDRIDRTLRLDGDLSDEQRARLVEIADRCPVHRTLTSETVIFTELLEGGGQ